MTLVNCEICGREVDKRGYNVHLRKCKEVQAKALQEKQDTIMKDKEQESDKKFKEEKIEEIKEVIKEHASKNPKARNWIKIIAAVLGLIAAGIIGVLMLISPKSKESSEKESPSKRPGSRLSR